MNPSIRDFLETEGLGAVNEVPEGTPKYHGPRLHFITSLLAAGTARDVSGLRASAIWDTDPDMLIVAPSTDDFVVIYDKVRVQIVPDPTLTPAQAGQLALGLQWIHTKKNSNVGHHLLAPEGVDFGVGTISIDGGIAAAAAAVTPVYGHQVPTPGWCDVGARVWDNLNDTVQLKPPVVANLPELACVVHVHGFMIPRPHYTAILELIDTPEARGRAIRRKLGHQLTEFLRAQNQNRK